MSASPRLRYGFVRTARVGICAATILAGFASMAYGQALSDSAVEQANRVRDRLRSETVLSLKLATQLEFGDVDLVSLGADRFATSAKREVGVQSKVAQQPRSKKRAFAGGVVGAVAGFFGGGFLGAAIEGDRCNCDDPGFLGFWIGAPIGTATGAILGSLFLF